MKKVLVATAALILVGSMATVVSAEVNLSGDARVRYIGQSDYQRVLVNGSENTNGYYDEFDSRIRIKFDAKAKGGAFMKARLRFDDFSQWDGQGWGMYSDDKNVWADYAFIGIPMGSVTIEGGRMPGNYSKFFSWDMRPTRLKATYKDNSVKIIGLIDVRDENTNNAIDEWNDNDYLSYALVGGFKIGDAWNLKAQIRYIDDSREHQQVYQDVTIATISEDDGTPGATYTIPGIEVPGVTRPNKDRSGFVGSIYLNGKAGTVDLEAEIAYKEADVLGGADNGLGGYVQAGLDMGAFTPALQFGMTTDGYQADPDFGFIMIGADEPITVVSTVGTPLGDAMWAAATANYTVNDRFKLAGNLVYYDIDINITESNIDVRRIADAIEVSGSVTYSISEGADLTYKLGYLSPSYDGRLNSDGISDDAYFGQYLRMAIKF